MLASRMSTEYVEGVQQFITFALDHGADPMRIICPCTKCDFSRTYKVNEIMDHLICNGINPDYKVWIWHGEKAPAHSVSCETSTFNAFDTDEGGRVEDMIHDIEQIQIDRPEMFDNFVNDAQRPLYPECTKFTRLFAVLKLYNLKVGNGWTDKSFTAFLELLREMLPDENSLPSSTYEAKKLIRSVGMDYVKIHACPNDCLLLFRSSGSVARIVIKPEILLKSKESG